MKLFPWSLVVLVFLALGCAHGSPSVSAAAPQSVLLQPEAIAVGTKTEEASPQVSHRLVEAGSESRGSKIKHDEPETAVKEEAAITSDRQQPSTIAVTANNTIDTDMNRDFVEEGGGEEKASIADPLEPFNRAMFQFNDKLYFSVLKPVAQAYGKVVPEVARTSVSNFFANLTFPVRFVNNLLQADLSGAATELGRFLINTIWGIGGLLDPASSKDIELAKKDKDFGQTLGVYGVGQGFYINWPIFGPSSPRDTVGLVGDFFFHPFTYYITAWDTSVGIRAYEKVNATSLSIGDYEALKEAAIDPYVAVRDAYVQYRLKKVNAGNSKPVPASTGEPDTVPARKQAP